MASFLRARPFWKWPRVGPLSGQILGGAAGRKGINSGGWGGGRGVVGGPGEGREIIRGCGGRGGVWAGVSAAADTRGAGGAGGNLSPTPPGRRPQTWSRAGGRAAPASGRPGPS